MAAFSAALMAMVAPAPARAQLRSESASSADPARQKAAVAAFKDGKTAFEAKNYVLAVDHFKRADDLVPGAAPRFMLGQAYEKLGKPSEAVAAYRSFLDLKPDPTSAAGKKIADAKARLVELESMLPTRLTVTVSPAGVDPVLVVDGASGLHSPLTLSPGRHTIVVTSPGYIARTETLVVGANESRDLAVVLKPEVLRVAPAPFTETPTHRGRVSTATVVCFGLAGAGAIAGGIFGGLAMKERARFYDAPSTEAADATERNALIADLAFGGALAASVTGAVLYLVTDRHGDVGLAPKVTPWSVSRGGGASLGWSF